MWQEYPICHHDSRTYGTPRQLLLVCDGRRLFVKHITKGNDRDLMDWKVVLLVNFFWFAMAALFVKHIRKGNDRDL
jgi:hypothetical protein